MGDEEVQEAALRFVHNPTERNRDLLTKLAMPLAKKKGHKMWASRNLTYDVKDGVESDAMLGLLQAINRWDPSQTPDFGAFLHRRVTSCVMDGFRSVDHLARSHRHALRVAGVENDSQYSRPISLNRPLGDSAEDAALIDMLADNMHDVVVSDLVESADMASVLKPIMVDLKRFRPQHHRVISMFVTNESLSSVAAEYGVTESRISQIKWEAVAIVQAAVRGVPVKPARPKGKAMQCKGPGCKQSRPGPTGRRGRPSVYCSDECKRAAARERLKQKEVKHGTEAVAEGRHLQSG